MAYNCLQDINGNWSSKRVAAFVSLGAFIGFGVADYITHSAHQYILDNLIWVTLGGLGLATAERHKSLRNGEDK